MDWVDDFVEYILSHYRGKVIEVGIGKFHKVAERLSEFILVTAVDIVPIHNNRFRFVKDDITHPDMSIYKNAVLLYSIRPPTEIHKSILEVGRAIGADVIIKPLGNEFPMDMVPVNYGRAVFYLKKWSEEE